jgi:predicted alpha/beta-hydrolase family hydrolase
VRTTSIDGPSGEIPLLLNEADGARAAAILAHGAGGGMRSEFMEFVTGSLVARGVNVWRFEFPYMAAGRRSPDRTPVLEETWRSVIDHLRPITEVAMFAGGKSMGGRIASQVVAGGTDVDGLVFLGYPLHPPGKPERLRADHLAAIRAPMLFVEGTRDPFCPLATLEKVLDGLSAQTDLVVISDGDHSYRVRKSSGRSTADAWSEVAGAVRDWIIRVGSNRTEA